MRGFLDAYGVAYELVPTLVRGLDYYTRTVFEFVNEGLDAAQASICAGGRYDYLIEEIGGPPTPGVGWAAGVERMAMSSSAEAEPRPLDLFVAFADRSRRRRDPPLAGGGPGAGACAATRTTQGARSRAS